jgi:A/G-specific adenine glycosylase
MNHMQLVGTNIHIIDAQKFRMMLIEWGQENFRSFPWRLTRDPYRILISEILLHRTQASQVLPIYEAFINRYPDVHALALATREELHEVLYSLGLRWRIDLLQEMGKELMTRFGGQIPQGRADLLSLPGVSDYIANAVRCFAWDKPEPLIDTNVVRVVSRVFELQAKDSSRRNSYYRKLITALVDPKEPRMYNYALLDLASLVCTKKQLPDCIKCPVRNFCVYGRQNLAISGMD